MEEDKTNTYVCPMHPEVRQEGPGRCPKCGMVLVEENAPKKTVLMPTQDRGLGEVTWRSYLPLLVVFFLLVAVSAVASWQDYLAGELALSSSLLYFMIGFFIVFAGFKLMDLKGFAEGYSTYDLLAKKVPAYGYLYPFIELGFGLVMLAGFHSMGILWAEFAVMAFSGIGVTIKIVKGEEFKCVCLGTFLKVPLTNVTLIEDFGMAGLALVLIFLG